ncbi:MAG: hypothetical protein K2Q06_01805 [Parvularculaceae bacterium]|nr:hypothetical protein [Parvularculaceae bacterium]
MPPLRLAPEWRIREWLNAPAPLSLETLRGRVVYAVAFQMLCPGCVSHALPQALRVRAVFDEAAVAVIGLHTVFEHHEAQGSRAALDAFLKEYRIGIPVGVDAPAAEGGLPQTMRLYAMQGTPTALLVDRAGRLRMQRFGHVDDLSLGASIQAPLGETPLADDHVEAPAEDIPVTCRPRGCEST